MYELSVLLGNTGIFAHRFRHIRRHFGNRYRNFRTFIDVTTIYLMKHFPFILVFGMLLCPLRLLAQQDIHLAACRQMAVGALAYERQQELIDLSVSAREKVLQQLVRPAVWSYGTLSYQSDVPDPTRSLGFNPGWNLASRDQYSAGVYLSQNIYDGGEYLHRKQDLQLQKQLRQLEVRQEEYRTEGLTDQIFMDAVLAEQGVRILKQQEDILGRQIQDAQALFDEGKLFKAEVLRLEAGLLELQARKVSLQAESRKLRGMLSELCGTTINDNDRLILPQPGQIPDAEEPFAGTFQVRSEQLRVGLKLSKASALPRVYVTAVGGYGKTMLNFFEGDPEWYGIASLVLKVPLSSWREYKQQARVLSAESELLDTRRTQYDKALSVRIREQEGEVAKYEALAAQDLQYIAQWEEIRKQQELMLRHGQASSSDYLNALMSETNARLNMEMHHIARIQAMLKRDHIMVESNNKPNE